MELLIIKIQNVAFLYFLIFFNKIFFFLIIFDLNPNKAKIHTIIIKIIIVIKSVLFKAI